VLIKVQFLTFLFLHTIFLSGCNSDSYGEKVYKGNHPYIHYVGRFDYENPEKPKGWAPGIYCEFEFYGANCQVEITDESYFTNHNYIEVAVDDFPVKRIKLSKKNNVISVANFKNKGIHHIIVCKSTEANIGYISFTGIRCEKLLPFKKKNKGIIEFIGDSMTCGNGADCENSADIQGDWYEQHAAYQSYGPVLARKLQMGWVLSSASGFGLTRSCCGNQKTIPQVYDYADLSGMQVRYLWYTKKPSIVFICLGQNDGLQKESTYCFDYVSFVKRIKKKNPRAHIVCLDSPMAKSTLKKHLGECINQSVNTLKKTYGNTIHSYFFKKRYHNGRLQHPNISEHQQMAKELELFVKKEKLFE
jgi:hypothetical protein